MIAKTPEYAPTDQVTSIASKNPAQPLVVDWPSAERGKLESQMKRGLVVVRYSGRTMQILDRCTVSANYKHRPITRKADRVEMRNVDALRASVPLSAVRFEAEVQRGAELDVDMTLVGRWEGDRTTVQAGELEGFCEGATDVVSALTVGAFTFSKVANGRVDGGATVLGAGASASSSARRAVLNEDGDESACAKASTADWSPPEGCGAPIRVEVVSLADARNGLTCKSGSHWDGAQCVSNDSGLAPLLLLLLAGL